MYQYEVKRVIDVIDGDTIKVVISLGFDIYLEKSLRLVDINAPDVRTLNEEVKLYGLRAKQKLEEYVNTGEGRLIVSTMKPNQNDIFGRVLGSLYKEGQPLTASEFMLANNYAWVYSPKVKLTDLSLLAPL